MVYVKRDIGLINFRHVYNIIYNQYRLLVITLINPTNNDPKRVDMKNTVKYY